jgi:hypothetical protein
MKSTLTTELDLENIKKAIRVHVGAPDDADVSIHLDSEWLDVNGNSPHSDEEYWPKNYYTKHTFVKGATVTW